MGYASVIFIVYSLIENRYEVYVFQWGWSVDYIVMKTEE